MNSREDKRIQLADRVERLAIAYLDIKRKMQTHALVMTKHNRLHGAYPNGAEQRLRVLHDKSERLRVRILRTHANLIELGLTSSFGDAPTTAPNQLPEDW